MNPNIQILNATDNLTVRLELGCDEAELHEQWLFVSNKSNQRWLWYAVDHATNSVLAYVFGKRKDKVFKTLRALLHVAVAKHSDSAVGHSSFRQGLPKNR